MHFDRRHSYRRTPTMLCAIIISALPLDSVRAADQLVIDRDLLFSQIFLYNGWLLEAHRRTLLAPGVSTVCSHEWRPLRVSDFPLPAHAALDALLQNRDHRAFSANDIAQENGRLDAWIELLAVGELVDREDSNRRRLAQLNPRLVGLHFHRPHDPRSLRNQYAAHAGIYQELESTASAQLKRLGMKDPSSPLDSTLAGDARDALHPVLKKAQLLGFPIEVARRVRHAADSALAALKEQQSSAAEREKRPVLYADLHGPLWELSDASRIGYERSTLMERASASAPRGLFADVISLAYASLVPGEDLSLMTMTARKEILITWLAETGLGKELRLTSLALTFPYGIAVECTCDDAKWAQLLSLSRAEGREEFDRRLFRKVYSVLGVDPAALTVTVEARPTISTIKWAAGHISVETLTQKSATERTSLKGDELRPILANLGRSAKDAVRKADGVPTTIKKVTADFLHAFGTLTIVRDENDHAVFRVRNARNMIVPGENLWEDADISLVIITSADTLTLICIVDGRWAKGIGRPQSLEGFRDMEPRYSKHLSEFAGRVLATAKAALLQGGHKPTNNAPR